MEAGDLNPAPEAAGTLPLTEAQRAIWVGVQINSAISAAFNDSWSIWLRGPFDEKAMRLALAELTRRHAALRLRFSSSGEGQTIADQSGLWIETRNLSGLGASEREAVLKEI